MEVTIINLQKKIALNPALNIKIKKAVRLTLLSEGCAKRGQVTVCLVDDRTISELNSKYLRHNNPTDVIAFNINLPAQETLSADLAISTDTVLANARIFSTSALYELLLYITHGTLHVLGYEDQAADKRRLMNEKSENILRSLMPKTQLFPLRQNAHT